MDIELSSPRDSPADVTGLYQEHALGLIRLAILMVGDWATAEDVVQDAFLGLHRHQERLDDPTRALPYVRTSVINGCRGVLRRRAVALRRGRTYEPPLWSAEDDAILSEERRQVLTAIARLPRRQREVLALRYYCDLPEEEIARTLNVSRGTVSSTTSRALTALRRILKEDS